MTTDNQTDDTTEGTGTSGVDGDDLTVFASTFAHDLRTPLLVARGHLELVEGDTDRIEGIETALDNVERIVDEMVTLARDWQAVRPSDTTLLGAAAHSAWEQVSSDGAHLRVESDRPIAADPNALNRILVNLFTNAVRHGPPTVVQEEGTPGQRVSSAVETARWARDNGFVVTVGALSDGFYVEDSGTGIPEELEGSVFEPGVTTGGTGLGLPIVRRFADTYGWTVDATTTPQGGARFSFRGVEPELPSIEGRSP